MKLNKQGVRDLNPSGYNGHGTKPGKPESVCAHLFEDVVENDWYLETRTVVRRCGFCHEVRR